MVLSFAPGWWGPPEMPPARKIRVFVVALRIVSERRAPCLCFSRGLLNDFRMAMDELLASPEQEPPNEAARASAIGHTQRRRQLTMRKRPTTT